MQFKKYFSYNIVSNIYIIVLLAVYSIFTGLNGYTNILEWKFGFLVTSTVIYLLCLSYSLYLIYSTYKSNIQTTSLSRFFQTFTQDKMLRAIYFSLVVFLAISFCSACFSEKPLQSFISPLTRDGWCTYLIYAIIFIAGSLSSLKPKSYLKFLGIPIIVNLILVILQVLNQNPLFLYPNNTRYSDGNKLYSGEYLGTFGNVDILSSFMCLVFPICIVYGLFLLNNKIFSSSNSIKSTDDLNDKYFKVIYILFGLIAISIILISKVQSGILSIILFIILLPFLYWLCVVPSTQSKIPRSPDNLSSPDKQSRCHKYCLIYFISLLICAIVSLLAIYIIPFNSGILHEMHQILHGNISDTFGTGRILIWKESLRLFLEHPILGTGPGSTAWRYTVSFHNNSTGRTAIITNAHNAYLGYLVNIGVLGFIILLVFFIMCLCKGYCNYKQTRDPIYIALFSAILIYMVQDFFNLNTCISAPYFWLSLGFLINTRSIK